MNDSSSRLNPFVKVVYDASNLEINHKTKMKGHFLICIDLLLKTLYQTSFSGNILIRGDLKPKRQQSYTSVSCEY